MAQQTCQLDMLAELKYQQKGSQLLTADYYNSNQTDCQQVAADCQLNKADCQKQAVDIQLTSSHKWACQLMDSYQQTWQPIDSFQQTHQIAIVQNCQQSDTLSKLRPIQPGLQRPYL